jgi:hypothetical protein
MREKLELLEELFHILLYLAAFALVGVLIAQGMLQALGR